MSEAKRISRFTKVCSKFSSNAKKIMPVAAIVAAMIVLVCLVFVIPWRKSDASDGE